MRSYCQLIYKLQIITVANYKEEPTQIHHFRLDVCNVDRCLRDFYQQSDNRIYQIACELVTPLTLNKIIYGIEIIEQNFGEQLAFTFDQKENLEFYLLQHLSHYLLN